MTRTPTPVSHQKMQELANLPLFHKLKGRSVLVAGYDAGAIWKTELIAATGADIDIFLGTPKSEMHERVLGGLLNVTIHERAWQISDFENRAIAVAQSVSFEDAMAFANAAKIAKVPVNIIDKPSLCDFTFGAIVNRSPLVIGISTDGTSPALGQELRSRLEAELSPHISQWLHKAREWRAKIKTLVPNFSQKRAFWHNFARNILDNPNTQANDALFSNLLDETPLPKGQVLLVGAGPGNAEMLTIGAVRALQSADVILVDDLVAPEIIDFARREAEIISVGKRGHKPSNTQASIIETMINYAKGGKNVVRLKGGDVLVFGRATEEIEACKKAEIPVKIIPGITTAQGVAASLGISMTDREYSRRVQYVTASGKNGCLPDDINFAAIADKFTTTFVYMPRHTINEFVEKALKSGLSPLTPAAIIVGATRDGQRNILTNIANIPKSFADHKFDAPEILMIGDVLKNADIFQNMHTNINDDAAPKAAVA